VPGRIAVVGAGSWGTTVASLACANAPTVLWARHDAVVSSIRQSRSNLDYLPGVELPAELEATSDLDEAVAGADLVVMAVPSHGFRGVFGALAPSMAAGTPVLSLTKGLEQGSQLRMTQIVEQVRPGTVTGMLTGPNLASEVVAGQPTAALVAIPDESLATWIQGLLMSPTFRVYTSPDVIGCEIAGASKNVLAVAAGISDGLGFGDNTRAALITRGLAEMGRLGVALGADPLTFAGLAGVGDLVATCTSHRSRNRTVGFALGSGRSLEEILAEMRMVAEGVKTARPVVELAAVHGIELPIAAEVVAVIDGTRTPSAAMAELMLRPATAELPHEAAARRVATGRQPV
jgi:glycerol-3-phosphate dehydrogenase (NAD(P)+)